MYAADEVYTDHDLDVDPFPWVEPCRFPVGAEPNETGIHLERCGLPAVDDEDEPVCAEHLTAVWP